MVARTSAVALVFLVANLVLIGAWARHERIGLEAKGEADAQEVARFAADRSAEDLATLNARMSLEDLREKRGLMGAFVLTPSGAIVAGAGDVAPDVVAAARRDGARVETEQVVIYRSPVAGAGLRAVAIRDSKPIEAEWRSVRNRAALAATVALLFAPLVGFLVAKLLAPRSPRAA